MQRKGKHWLMINNSWLGKPILSCRVDFNQTVLISGDTAAIAEHIEVRG
jgi:hypothetical protein